MRPSNSRVPRMLGSKVIRSVDQKIAMGAFGSRAPVVHLESCSIALLSSKRSSVLMTCTREGTGLAELGVMLRRRRLPAPRRQVVGTEERCFVWLPAPARILREPTGRNIVESSRSCRDSRGTWRPECGRNREYTGSPRTAATAAELPLGHAGRPAAEGRACHVEHRSHGPESCRSLARAFDYRSRDPPPRAAFRQPAACLRGDRLRRAARPL